jgi:hypothetical protein
MARLAGKVALISGGAGGQGAAEARWDMLENRAAWEQRLRRLPTGRVGTPDEVAYGACTWLRTNRPT